ncbi:hypothetical protein IBT47_12715 [Erwinia sp. S43]|uniref:hypothetical protein n=1 Tax=unclassified Erwinia TaxID=2622719 RepID=UPI00190C8BDD|nr:MULTISPECIES: hypothetical protein [unclassified Erwinia]MBK0033144.1 hypothetical protein [Erwinia sp. S43]MCW1875862.1 hypothetical protein [Erwinia sp. INIA01]
MKKILFFCFAALCLIAGGIIIPGKKNTYFANNKLVLSCSAKVDIEIRQPDALAHMEGRLSLTTLGSKRLALLYTGRLVAPEGRFILSRTLLMDYRYHPENHALELSWGQSIVSETDTVPDEVFYRNLMKSRSFILYLTRFNQHAWLVSGLTTPLYVCNDE